MSFAVTTPKVNDYLIAKVSILTPNASANLMSVVSVGLVWPDSNLPTELWDISAKSAKCLVLISLSSRSF
jgi:hypothetical protein